MKLNQCLFTFLVICLTATTAPAQEPAGQRGGGGRGAGNNSPQNDVNGGKNGAFFNRNPDLVNEIRLILDSGFTVASTNRGLLITQVNGAWWTNTALITRLGLTDDQKFRLEKTYENHRQNLVSSKETLEKEEAQLAKLLEADPLERGSIVTQIYRVVQARGDMEKTNALMTLEMREVLSRAQWMQLQVQQSFNVKANAPNQVTPAGVPAGQTGGRGGRGQP